MASNTNLLPRTFFDLWPLLLVIVGLGGLLTSDKEEWDGQPKSTLKKKTRTSSAKKSSKKSTKTKKTTKKSTKKKTTSKKKK